MKTTLIATCLLALSACASDQRPGASAQTEPNTVGGERAARVKRHDARPAPVATAGVAPEPIATPTDANTPQRERTDTTLAADPADRRDRNDTAVNARDVDHRTVTPVDQRENQSDLEVTRRIRKAVVNDDSLSFAAKNAKIVSRDGRVTLRGTVKSASERTVVADHAGQVVGATHVDNELEVAP